MALDVFISHPSKDKAVADAACHALEGRGVRCWIAPRDIPPGSDWSEQIVKALDESRALVIVFSSNANESKQVYRELSRAANRGIPILPLRIEDTLPSAGFSYYLETVHWLDALDPPLEMHLERLTDQVSALLPADRAAVPGDQQTSQSPSRVGGSEAAELKASTESDEETTTVREEEERRERLDGLYEQARRSHQAQEWQAVVEAFERIRALDPEYPNPEGLFMSAREALFDLRQAQRAATKVAALYEQGFRHMEAEEWPQALKCFEELQRLEPDYRRTESLLSQVRHELAKPPTVEVPDLTGKTLSQREWKAVVSAVAAVVAGVAWIAPTALETLDPVGSNNLHAVMFIIALLGTLGVLVVLHTWQAPNYGRLGLIGFLGASVGIALTTLFLLLGVSGLFGLFALQDSLGTQVAFVLLGGGHVLLGIATLRARVLPRWYGLLFVIVGIISLPLAYDLELLFVGGMVLGPLWMALGYALWSQRGALAGRPTRPA